MSTPLFGHDGGVGAVAGVVTEIVLPVRDEQAVVEASVRRLHTYLRDEVPVRVGVTIVDNGSTDDTWAIAQRLAEELDGVEAVRVEESGRGRAVRTAWMASAAPIVAYMDIDLSTGLDALLPLLAPIMSGHSEVSVGTRLAPHSRVVRGGRRELVSRTYNRILAIVLGAGFSDAQCGFKAVRGDIAQVLVPLVVDDGWFFDTELLVLAENAGLRIHEVPVDWVDDADSRVRLIADSGLALRLLWRLVRHTGEPAGLPGIHTAASRSSPRMTRSGRFVRFCSIGIVSTLVFGAIFAALARPLGPAWADVVALMSCTVANTAANRRLTFDLRGAAGRGRQLAAGLVVGLVPLVLNLVALFVLDQIGVTSLPWQLATLTIVNLVAAVFRFALLSLWVFPEAADAGAPDAGR